MRGPQADHAEVNASIHGLGAPERVRMRKGRRPHVKTSSDVHPVHHCGHGAGYLIFHPYAMAVHPATHVHRNGELHLHWKELFSNVSEALGPTMFTMSLPFIIFGGVIGLLMGIIVERTRKLEAEKFEHEIEKVALETLKKLMVTLSHYLLNANMISLSRCRSASVRVTMYICDP